MSEERVSRALSARAAVVARRLAALLDATCSAESGAPAAAGFLRDWAEAALADDPATSERDPLDVVVDRFGLGDAERDLLLLAGLPEEHEGLAGTFRRLNPRSEPRPTLGLAALVLGTAGGPALDRPGLRRLLAEGPAVRHGLLRVGHEPAFYERALAPAERLWDALHGHDAWPDGVGRVIVDEAPVGLDDWLALPAVELAVRALSADADRTLLLSAEDPVIAASRCAALCRAAGRTAVGAQVGATDRAAIDLVSLHAAARAGVPLLVLPPPEGDRATPGLDVTKLPGPVLVCAPPGAFRPVGLRPVLRVPLGPVRHEGQLRAWRDAIPDLAEQAGLLTARHPLDPSLIAEVAADARSLALLAEPVSEPREVSDVVRGRAGITLPPGVRLLTPSPEWDRLVLPEELSAQLHDAVSRLKHGSQVLDTWGFLDRARADRGVRLMFAGPPGTGKSLAAEVVANAIGTDLLVVDVSQVVSKWLGETEKNLAAVFDVAERTQAVLMLDEADALFAARTGISDSHDRYANLETSYLLQRMDRFEGLMVLATNLRQNIDAAFLRRLDFVVDFPLPSPEERLALWRIHLPEDLLARDVDLTSFAALYAVPGGWIRNAAVAAAFLAAPEGEPRPVRRSHLVRALAREYAKATKPFPGRPATTSKETAHERTR
ncbi:hypothetical protein RKD27_001343 [Streptomyces sp. SAI-126]|uniref:ATP-binding protein n=1 Tax=Streptomyces sp. SAI-126 TaxID=3377732 RepID=UPI003C7BD32A